MQCITAANQLGVTEPYVSMIHGSRNPSGAKERFMKVLHEIERERAN